MTTTEKTVSVPVAVLQRLRGGFIEERPMDNTITARREAVLEVLDYLPEPPKVGDVAHADNWRSLPVGTVLRDKIDDLWIVGPGETVSYLNPRRVKPQTFVLTDPAWAEYTPVIISLPEESK